MIQKELVHTLIEEQLEGSDKYLVELKISASNKILIFIDSDSGVTIKDCVELSKFIESKIDREVEDYDLDVSSAGLDHEFKCLRQYQKNIGKTLAVVLNSNIKLTGTLISVNEKEIELNVIPAKKKKTDTDNPINKIELAEIKEAKIVISFKK